MTVHQFCSDNDITVSEVKKILKIETLDLFRVLNNDEIQKIIDYKEREGVKINNTVHPRKRKKKISAGKPEPWNKKNYKYPFVRIITVPNNK